MTGELGAVGGFGQPSLGEQVIHADGDDDRGRYPSDAGLVGGFEEPGAGILQRVVQPLYLWPLVGDVEDGAVWIVDAAWCGVWSTGPGSR